MKGQIQKTLRAFTLIEIMVVVTIVGIISSLLLVGFSNSRTKREVETNAREFVGVVREMQNNALSGKQLVTVTDPCHYNVDWSGASYTVTYHYKIGGGNCSSPSNSTYATYPLKGGVTFSTSGPLEFYPPHAAIKGISGGSKAAVFTKQGVSHVACVYPNGRILDQVGSTCP